MSTNLAICHFQQGSVQSDKVEAFMSEPNQDHAPDSAVIEVIRSHRILVTQSKP